MTLAFAAFTRRGEDLARRLAQQFGGSVTRIDKENPLPVWTAQQFLEKEGVVLNKSKTKARIERIEPGKAAGLQAMVTLPENLKEQELLNEVTVTTLETGGQVMTSQAKIQIRAAEEVETEEADRMSVDMDNSAVSHTGESYPASTHPKTGDPYQPFLWLAMIPGSMLAAGWIRRRM